MKALIALGRWQNKFAPPGDRGMLRIVYSLAVVTLIGASAVTAQNMDRDARPERGAAIAMLATMQR